MVRHAESDLLRISDDLIPDIPRDLDRLLKKGRTSRVKILDGSESPSRGRKPIYARTEISILFSDEEQLRTCVRMLRWSDARLRLRPDQFVMWDWDRSFRDGMAIEFGVNWYDRKFFEARKDAFRNAEHESYYAQFGASADQFKVEHVVLAKPKPKTK